MIRVGGRVEYNSSHYPFKGKVIGIRYFVGISQYMYNVRWDGVNGLAGVPGSWQREEMLVDLSTPDEPELVEGDRYILTTEVKLVENNEFGRRVALVSDANTLGVTVTLPASATLGPVPARVVPEQIWETPSGRKLFISAGPVNNLMEVLFVGKYRTEELDIEVIRSSYTLVHDAD